MITAGLIILAYLAGSISPSVFLGRLIRGVDVRKHGSGNAGTTNAFRVLGPVLGAIVLVLDIAKGYLPVLLAKSVSGPTVTVLVALAAMAGHNWSIFLKGRGGKGVATGAGVILAMMPLAISIMAATFAVVLLATSLVSLASIVATLLLPVLTIALSYPLPYVAFSIVACIVVITAHRNNIKRLWRRQEPRIGIPWHRVKVRIRPGRPSKQAQAGQTRRVEQ